MINHLAPIAAATAFAVFAAPAVEAYQTGQPVAASASQVAKPTPRSAPAAAGGGSGARVGSYECWAWGQARMNMNFRITGPGSYRNASGSGTFKVGPGGKLALTGPMLESMPDGFSAVYHAPGGKPTVSFRGPSGSEAAFCELAG